MADTIGTAYVQIEPSFDGVVPKIDKELGGAGESGGNSFSQGFGKVMGGIGKAVASGLATGGAAVGAMAKQAVDAYADYEQLTGGIETLFGDTAEAAMKNAENAFQTAGLSANEYMETVTGFAAALKGSLGDEYAWQMANYADVAVQDMADNANKMGSSMESIQNAYQGFAKQNYTMLDNLKLGYGGTKQEMERLLRDAEELEGYEVGSLDMENFSDIVDAIHIIQENMGITGTTAKEASETISGSFAMLQSAWQNTLTAIGTGDMNMISKNITDLVSSAATYAENLMPIIQNALEGISQLITELAPKIAEALPQLLTTVLPSLLTAAVNILQALGEGLIQAIPELMPTITQVMIDLCNMLVSMAPELIQVGLQMVVQLAMGIAQALPELMPAIVDTIITIVEYLIDNIDLLIDAAVAIITALADGLINAVPVLIDKIPEIIIKLVDAFISNLPKIMELAVELVLTLIKGIFMAIPQLIAAIGKMLVEIYNKLKEAIPNLLQIGKELINGLWQGIKSSWGDLKGNFNGLTDGLIEAAKKKFSIGSPSKVFADEVGQWIPAGIAEGINEGSDVLTSAVDDMTSSTINQGISSEIVQVSNQAQSADAAMGGGIDGLFSLLSEYLPLIAQGLAVNVNMSPDTDRLFDMIVEKNNSLAKSNGGGGAFA